MYDDILDSDLEQPEQPEETYTYASFWARVGATLIDSMLFVPLVFVSFYNLLEWKIYGIEFAIGLLNLIYKPLLEGIYGATVGKMMTRLRVVDADYYPINLPVSILRNILYIGAGLVGMYSTFLIYESPGFADITSFNDLDEFIQYSHSFAGWERLASMIVLLSCLLVLFDKYNQSLHDKIARTYVLKKETNAAG